MKKIILISAAYSDMAIETIHMLKEQFDFVLIGRNRETLDKIITDNNISSQTKAVFSCDITDLDRCYQIAGALKRDNISLNGFINFAGQAPVKARIDALECSTLQSELNLRVFGNINLAKAFLGLMQPGSSIAIVNGILAKMPDPDLLCGSIALGAVKNLAKALSKDFASRQIRVNSVNPCASDTKMKDAFFSSIELTTGISAQTIQESVAAKIPLGRLCSTYDVACLLKFLMSDESAFMTGQSIDIDGGYNAS